MNEPDNALIAIRTFVYADLLLLFGLPLFGLYGFSTASEAVRVLALRLCGLVLGVAGLVLTFVQLAAMAAAMAGTPLLSSNLEHIHMLVRMDGTGTSFIVRFAALVFVVLLATTLRSRPRGSLGALCVCAAVAVGTLAWAGHGAMQGPGSDWGHVIADVVHLIAAGGWIGALTALSFMLFKPKIGTDRAGMERLAKALRGFAGTGTLLVGVIAITGIVNVVSIVGWPHLGGLVTSPYGRLLAAKLALFAAMLGLASGNRFWFAPALGRVIRSGDAGAALKALRLSLALESACALTILALVAALGLLAPPR